MSSHAISCWTRRDATSDRRLLARGEGDDWYANTKLEADASALRARHTAVDTLVYPDAHKWTAEVAAAAARFIGRNLAR